VYLRRAREAHLDWAAVAAMDDAVLERALAGEPPAAPAKPARALPDVAHIKRELAKPDMTVGVRIRLGRYRRVGTGVAGMDLEA
jgi:transposase